MKLNEIAGKRARLVEEGRKLLNEAKDGILNAEERAKYDAIMADVTAMGEQAKIVRRQEEVENELAQSDGLLAEPEKGEDRDAKYFEELRRYLKTGFDGPTMRAVSVDAPTQGGYAIPRATSDMIRKKIDDQTFIMQMADVINVTKADSLGIPTLENDPSDADWTGEVSSVSEDSTMSFGSRELSPSIVSKLLKVSMKMLDKMPDMASFIQNRLAYKFAVTLEKAAMTGNGAGQPLGLFTASNEGISTGRDYSTGNADTSVDADNLIGNLYNVKAGYRRNGVWIGSRTFFQQVHQLKGGDGQYIWQPSYQAGRPDTLLGKPCMESEFAPSTFTTGLYVALFGDLKYYQVAMGMNFAIQRLNELYAGNNQIGFIGRAEADGMPIFEEAFTRVKLG